MKPDAATPPPRVLTQRDGRLHAVLQAHGGLRSLQCGGLMVNLFPASALEAGPANLWLRCHEADGRITPVPLLGPAAPGRQCAAAGRVWHQGDWHGVHYRVELTLAAAADAWFWHLHLHNAGGLPLRLDLVYLQDLALAPWGAIRLNEAYISQYLDHQPLAHATHGWLLATRQNAPVQGRAPWLLSGSLGRAVAYATDALQVLGLAARAGQRHGRLDQPLPSQRLQHEHALAALQESAFDLPPGSTAQHGFYGWLVDDHPAASGGDDLARVAQVLALPEAQAPASPVGAHATAAPVGAHTSSLGAAVGGAEAGQPAPADPRSLFACAPLWPSAAPDRAQLLAWFGGDWRHEELGPQGELMSFFQGEDGHVITRDHELRVLRPHGHLLRSGGHWTPDERAVLSTVWMAGVFHSSLTQGHASANRCLSTQRGYLALYRGLGQRVFVDAGSGWQLLDVPSAMRLTPTRATWLYQAGEHCIELVADAAADAPELGLRLRVIAGPPVAVLVSHHLAFNSADGSDDGLGEGPVHWQVLVAGLVQPDHPPQAWLLRPAPGSEMASRFATGGLHVACHGDGAPAAVLGDEALFFDGRSRRQPYFCLRWAPLRQASISLQCTLVPTDDPVPAVLGGGPQPPALHWQPPGQAASGGASQAVLQLADWLPWLAHNALVHYLTPRGLEQFSGGGWGTRDVCQGPAELLLALGRHDALRDLLCRVFAAQNADGDWPQWFMFYPRDAHVRASDSHGDIVFWPLVALADYLLASGDATLLAQPLPFHAAPGDTCPPAPVREHLARALAVVARRTIAGTRLAAYGHGDWNDALQPADPALREHLCSAWTVTLHHRTLRSLAAAWRRLGDAAAAAGSASPVGVAAGFHAEASRFAADANAVLADFQRLLVVDGVVTGYALFEPGAPVDYLLHPRDARTGISLSALPMVHAVLDELFTPEQAAAHAQLLAGVLQGPDGLRLFDRPLRYRGGPMALFQRGESASYFGREIGLMYMHAHLRWAEALAHLGRADDFLHALRLANPIGLQALLPQAAPRQRNCYYSSSDAAFTDRNEAWAHYDRIHRGEVALEGGWRIYSSGAGIAYRLVLQRLLGLVARQDQLGIDPVLSPALDGLVVRLPLYGHPVDVHYRVGPLGHGPLAVALDGQPLALSPGHNRYRTPGVWVDAEPLRQRLAAGATRLHITLG